MWTIESDERILILWKLESSPSNSFADLIGPPCRSRLGLVTWDPYQSFQVTPPMSYLLEINQLILLSLHSSFSQQGTLCSPSVQRTNSMNQQWNYIVLAVSQHPVYQSSSNIHISNLQLVKFGPWTSAPQIPHRFCFCQSCLWHKSDNPSYNQSDSRRKPRWNKLWTSSGVFSPKVVEFLMFKVFHDEDIEILGKGNVKIEFWLMDWLFQTSWSLMVFFIVDYVAIQLWPCWAFVTCSTKCSRCCIWGMIIWWSRNSRPKKCARKGLRGRYDAPLMQQKTPGWPGSLLLG